MNQKVFTLGGVNFDMMHVGLAALFVVYMAAKQA